MKALTCCGLYFLPSISCDHVVPMWRLTERMVRSTLVTAWRFATSPTSTSAFLANATTLGVVRLPSALAMTVGSPPSRTLTTEFVVPRSIPTARAMSVDPSRCCWCLGLPLGCRQRSSPWPSGGRRHIEPAGLSLDPHRLASTRLGADSL